jgi:hypothetical protein
MRVRRFSRAAIRPRLVALVFNDFPASAQRCCVDRAK